MNWLTSLSDHVAARTVSKTVSHLLGDSVRDMTARLGGVPDHVWRHPYALGFLATLITLVAGGLRRLGPNALGVVQVKAWQRLTRIDDPSIGERICVLAAGCDGAFLRGCTDARDYFDRLVAGGLTISPEGDVITPHLDGSGAADHVWSGTIERHLASIAQGHGHHD